LNHLLRSHCSLYLFENDILVDIAKTARPVDDDETSDDVGGFLDLGFDEQQQERSLLDDGGRGGYGHGGMATTTRTTTKSRMLWNCWNCGVERRRSTVRRTNERMNRRVMKRATVTEKESGVSRFFISFFAQLDSHVEYLFVFLSYIISTVTFWSMD
jgi:hypothetical protein